MRKFVYFGIAMFLWACISLATPGGPPEKTFVGNISDSMCGLKHRWREGTGNVHSSASVAGVSSSWPTLSTIKFTS